VDTLELGTDESYELHVDFPAVNITAETPFGAMHALETLEQLTTATAASGHATLPQRVAIRDAPRFPWRGLMVDTSRHFMPVEALLRTIEALSMNRMNVFHWHIVDSQSFPFESKVWPKMAEQGAYSPGEKYSLEDVATVVSWAHERGVMVIPEFDGPGSSPLSLSLSPPPLPPFSLPCFLSQSVSPLFHVALFHTTSLGHTNAGWRNWAASEFGEDELVVCPDLRPAGLSGQLDPSNPFMYTVLEGLLEEVAAHFPSSFIHIGADEVSVECWNGTEKVMVTHSLYVVSMSCGTGVL
jgi:hexosaminidase